MIMIKKYIQFINEDVVPELKSWDDLTEIRGKSIAWDARPLKETEKELIDEYCKKFEEKFLLTQEQINEVLLDLDLIDNITIKITNIITKFVDGEEESDTDFNFRKETEDVRGILSLKSWYDHYIGVTIRPKHLIVIEKNPKTPFDNEKVYEYLLMVKETFEEMCECDITIDKGDAYSMRFIIEYPETTIE